MTMRYLALAAVLAFSPVANAQGTAATQVADGDRAYAAMDPRTALAAYERAVAEDSSNYEALWKASRTAVDLAEYEPDKRQQAAWFALGERLARKAVAVEPNDAEGYFTLARALGRVALTKGVKERVRYGTEVRADARKALELDPNHPGALHVLGRWNAEIMRLNGFQRFFAKNFLGGQVFGEASWDKAQRYLEQAVANDPQRLVHHLGLAEIYLDRDMPAEARTQLELVVNGTPHEYNDRFYQRDAKALLDRMGAR